MSDLIFRENVLNNFENMCEVCFAYMREKKEKVCRKCFIQTVKEIIKESSSAEPERTVKVKRVPYSNTITYNFDGECECGKCVGVLWDYCPHCGAKLDWSEE